MLTIVFQRKTHNYIMMIIHDLLSTIRDRINMANQGLHDGVTVDDFRGVFEED
jgi:hypothetical protein